MDTHFFERFGGAILLTLLNIGGAAITDSSDTSIVIASTRAGVDAGASSLASGANVRPYRDRAAGLPGSGVREPGSRFLDSRAGQGRRELIGEGVYLRTYLAPFAPWLDRPDVTDILVNKPGEVWIDRRQRASSRSQRLTSPKS